MSGGASPGRGPHADTRDSASTEGHCVKIDIVDNFEAMFGPVSVDHVGIAVHDMEAALPTYRGVLGVGPWTVGTFEADVMWRGAEARVGGIVAKARMGPISVELVQPTIGTWTPTIALDARGEGLYHIGYYSRDLPAVLRSIEAYGITPALVASDDDGPIFTYLDPDDLHGVTLEIIGDHIPQTWVDARIHVP